jgi:hypothetical protein
MLWVNERMIEINQNQTLFPVFQFSLPTEINIAYSKQDKKPPTDLVRIQTINPDWNNFIKKIIIDEKTINSIQIKTEFPIIKAELSAFPTINCSSPYQGGIKTVEKNKEFFYQAYDFGVNCHHFDFANIEFNYPYLLLVDVENIKGRGIKFFINYREKNSLLEEYITPQGNFSEIYNFLPLNSYPSKFPAVNWETRSYGKKAESKLNSIKASIFPVDLIANIYLKNKNLNPYDNKIKIVSNKSFLTFFYLVKYQCVSESCYLGINQSYDDLWIALDNKLNILPHSKYNNWANIWQLKNTSKTVIIIYLPQIFSYLSMILLIFFIIYLVLRSKDYK